MDDDKASGDSLVRARNVTALLAAQAARIEALRELPADVVSALHEARLFRLALPRTLDGDEADLATLAQAAEIVAAADASTAWCLGQAAGCAMAAAYLRPDVARRVFGPSHAVLAWGAGAQGKAVAVDGGYRVTGSWMFASGSRHATWLGGHSKVFEVDGRPRLRADGRQLERTALFTREKARIDDNWQVVGLRGTGSDGYAVADLFVPDEETLDREGPSERRETGTLFRFSGSLVYAAPFAGVMLGIARGSLNDLMVLATAKTPRGTASSLRDSPIFQSQTAQMEARLRAARTYHLQALTEVWNAVAAGQDLTLQRRIDMRLAATYAMNEGLEVVTAAYRAAGQNAIFDANPFERRLRDALAASQQVQARPTHFVTAGRCLLGLPPDTTMFL